MQFGLDKCKINGVHKGEFQTIDPHAMINGETTIQAVDHQKMYKYLGVLKKP